MHTRKPEATSKMSSAVPAIATPSAWATRRNVNAVIILGCLIFLVLGYHREPRVFHFRDFKQPYASARCLLHGCDPYSESATEAQFVAAHGRDTDKTVFVPYSALYPPPSLLLLTPIAALPYPVAQPVWMLLISALYCLAAFLIGSICLEYGSLVAAIAVACFVANSDVLLMLGQVSGVVVSLAVIGLWAMLRDRKILAIVCISFAICLKPHDVIFFLPYFFFAGRSWRKGLTGIVALTALITLVAVLWFSLAPASSHWFGELRANIAGNSGQGGIDSPGPDNNQGNAIANLQAIFAVIHDNPHFYGPAAYALSGLLFLVWLYPAIKMRVSLEKHLLSLACLASLTLMPIYHREYDTRLLLIVFPALAFLLVRHRALGILGLLLTCFEIFPQLDNLLWAGPPAQAHLGVLHFLLAYRLMQIMNLAIAIFFLAVFVWMARRPSHETSF